MKATPQKLLLIFTRNPELGKCKTRLAATVGDEAALEIYKFLLAHTVSITEGLFATKAVYYSDTVWENDIWNNRVFEKKLQKGTDLGARMANAFQEGFEQGFEHIVIIGSDMYDLNQLELENAFSKLAQSDYVLGPAQDGGYYLLGMKKYNPKLFENKIWGTDTVLKDTLNDLKGENVSLLPLKNDIDVFDDIKDIEEFQGFIKNMR